MKQHGNSVQLRLNSLGIFSLLLVFPLSLWAQTSEDSAENSGALEEVIVTAQKREQAISEIPIAITAITSTEIEARGITNLIEAQYTVPGLTLSEFAPGQQRAQLRGIGTPGGATGLATVGFYLDEVPVNIGSAVALDVRLLDLERVEVLRGPQPTLYGEGSMGGTIRYITASPDMEGFSGRVAGRWGAITDGSAAYRASGMINAPFGETFGVRLVAGYENTGGWIDQDFTGRKDVNEMTLKTIRAKALFQPTDRFSLSVMALHQEQDADFQNFGNRDTRSTVAVFPGAVEDEYDIINAVASYDFGSSTLLASYGRIDRELLRGNDITSPFIFAFFELLGVPPGAVQGAGLVAEGEFEMDTFEIRWQSNGDGPFNYLLGYYQRTPKNRGINYGATIPDGVLPFDPFASSAENESDAYALFGEISYRFNEKWEAGVGARYFEDEQKNIVPIARKATFDTTNPKFFVSYHQEDGGLVYFNASKGFRSGGFNNPLPPPLPAPPPTYDPEELWSYELGTKQSLFDRRMNLEVALYYNDWQDVQGPSLGFLPFNVITNGADASGPGLDISLSALLTDNLVASATYGYVGMEYDTDTAAHKKGETPDMVSDSTWSVSLDYNRNTSMFGGSEFNARADYQYTSGYNLTLNDLFPSNPITKTGSRSIVNLRAGLDFGSFETYLFVENATDDDGELYPAVASLPEPVIARPRVIGVGVSLDF